LILHIRIPDAICGWSSSGGDKCADAGIAWRGIVWRHTRRDIALTTNLRARLSLSRRRQHEREGRRGGFRVDNWGDLGWNWAAAAQITLIANRLID